MCAAFYLLPANIHYICPQKEEMNFFHPAILYALSLAALPIIIHLINLRRHRKMYFSSLWFLQNISAQTKRSRKLYEWLLLLFRTLMIAALVLAFAGPYIDRGSTGKHQSLHMIIDNTLSMQGSNRRGNLYDQAKNKAKEIAGELENNQTLSVHYLANGSSHRSVTSEEARQIIGRTPMRQGHVTFNQLLTKIKTRNDQAPNVIFISDFQQNTLYPDTVFRDSSLNVNLIPIEQQSLNISIDSLWFDSPLHIPDQALNLNILINNHSGEAVEELPVKVKINEQLLSAGTADIEPNAQTVYETSMETSTRGLLKIKVNIEDIPITFDNTYFSGVFVLKQLQILETGKQPSPYFRALFNDSATFSHQFMPVDAISLSAIDRAGSIILHHAENLSAGIAQSILQNVRNGGNLVVVPKMQKSVTGINEITELLELPAFEEVVHDSTQIREINQEHFLLSNAIEHIDERVKLPAIHQYYKVKQSASTTPVLYNDLNDAVLLHIRSGKGNIYVFTFDALQPTFATRPLFVPLFYNAVSISNKNLIPAITCSQSGTVSIKGSAGRNRDQTVEIVGQQHRFIPYSYHQQNMKIISIRSGQISTPGFYEIMQNDSLLNIIAANHDRNESVMQFYSESVLNNQILHEARTSIFNINDQATDILSPAIKLWKYFVIFAIVMLAAESLLIYFKDKKRKIADE